MIVYILVIATVLSGVHVADPKPQIDLTLTQTDNGETVYTTMETAQGEMSDTTAKAINIHDQLPGDSNTRRTKEDAPYVKLKLTATLLNNALSLERLYERHVLRKYVVPWKLNKYYPRIAKRSADNNMGDEITTSLSATTVAYAAPNMAVTPDVSVRAMDIIGPGNTEQLTSYSVTTPTHVTTRTVPAQSDISIAPVIYTSPANRAEHMANVTLVNGVGAINSSSQHGANIHSQLVNNNSLVSNSNIPGDNKTRAITNLTNAQTTNHTFSETTLFSSSTAASTMPVNHTASAYPSSDITHHLDTTAGNNTSILVGSTATTASVNIHEDDSHTAANNVQPSAILETSTVNSPHAITHSNVSHTTHTTLGYVSTTISGPGNIMPNPFTSDPPSISTSEAGSETQTIYDNTEPLSSTASTISNAPTEFTRTQGRVSSTVTTSSPPTVNTSTHILFVSVRKSNSSSSLHSTPSTTTVSADTGSTTTARTVHGRTDQSETNNVTQSTGSVYYPATPTKASTNTGADLGISENATSMHMKRDPTGETTRTGGTAATSSPGPTIITHVSGTSDTNSKLITAFGITPVVPSATTGGSLALTPSTHSRSPVQSTTVVPVVYTQTSAAKYNTSNNKPTANDSDVNSVSSSEQNSTSVHERETTAAGVNNPATTLTFFTKSSKLLTTQSVSTMLNRTSTIRPAENITTEIVSLISTMPTRVPTVTEAITQQTPPTSIDTDGTISTVRHPELTKSHMLDTTGYSTVPSLVSDTTGPPTTIRTTPMPGSIPVTLSHIQSTTASIGSSTMARTTVKHESVSQSLEPSATSIVPIVSVSSTGPKPDTVLPSIALSTTTPIPDMESPSVALSTTAPKFSTNLPSATSSKTSPKPHKDSDIPESEPFSTLKPSDETSTKVSDVTDDGISSLPEDEPEPNPEDEPSAEPDGEPEPDGETEADPDYPEEVEVEPETEPEDDWEPETFAEPGPDWALAKLEWKQAWQFHVYFFGACFVLLGMYCLLSVMRLWHMEHLLSRRYFLTLNMLIVCVCLFRALYLLVDAYNSNGTFPVIMNYFLYSTVFPFITAAFSILFFALLLATRVRTMSSKVQKLWVLLTIIGFHFCLSIVTDVVVGLFSTASVLLLICQFFFILWGLMMFVGYLIVFSRIHRASVPRSNARTRRTPDRTHNTSYDSSQSLPKQRYTIGLAVKVTLASAVFGLGYICFELYGIFGVYGILRTTRPDAWPWYIYHTIVRTLELLMCSSVAYVAAQPIRYNHKKSERNVIYVLPCKLLCCHKRRTDGVDGEFSTLSMEHYTGSETDDFRWKQKHKRGHMSTPPAPYPPHTAEKYTDPDATLLVRKLQPSMLVVEDGFVRIRRDDEVAPIQHCEVDNNSKSSGTSMNSRVALGFSNCVSGNGPNVGASDGVGFAHSLPRTDSGIRNEGYAQEDLRGRLRENGNIGTGNFVASDTSETDTSANLQSGTESLGGASETNTADIFRPLSMIDLAASMESEIEKAFHSSFIDNTDLISHNSLPTSLEVQSSDSKEFAYNEELYEKYRDEELDPYAYLESPSYSSDSADNQVNLSNVRLLQTPMGRSDSADIDQNAKVKLFHNNKYLSLTDVERIGQDEHTADQV